MKKHTDANSSSAFQELKETIKRQQVELEALRKQMKQRQTSHHHHGPPDVAPASSFLSNLSQRLGWLSVFLVSLSFTAIIMKGYEHTLSHHVQLATFVPLLAGHGGNTGGQAVGTVLSGMARGGGTMDAVRVIQREALTGLLMGLVLGVAVGVIAGATVVDLPVAVTVCLSIPWISTVAATVGSSLPYVCVWFNLGDPAVIAAPAMTSLVDVCGLLSYFWIAQQVLLWYGMEL